MKQLTPGQVNWRIGIIKSYNKRLETITTIYLRHWLLTRINKYQAELMEHSEQEQELT